MTEIIKAVIFDMDGVIIDSEPIYRMAAKAVVSKYGGVYDSSVSDKEMGLSIKESSKIVVKETGIEIDPERFAKEYIEQYLIFCEKFLKPNENIEKLIAYCHDNFKTAIASSTVRDIVIMLMDRFGFLKYFQFVVGGDEVERSKPHPGIYLKAAGNLEVDPHECVVIEDSYNGAVSAVSAGMTTLVLRHDLNRNISFPQEVTVFEDIDSIVIHLKNMDMCK